jgi:predicted phage-related endonuclease
MADFSPQARNSAIWSGDARQIAAGRAADVWLTKTGQQEIEDISDVEAVQWGLRLQEPIARAVGDRLKVRLKELDIEGTHVSLPWMRSHFDFVSDDNKTLFEIKNYNLHARSKFGEDGSQDVPPADMAQVIHEAAVFNVTTVNLCVLFGGQELCIYPIHVDDAMKQLMIDQEAKLWAHIQTRQPPEATDPEDLRRIFRQDSGQTKIANQEVEAACIKLRAIKNTITNLEDQEKILTGMVQAWMSTASVIDAPDGKTLVTWKKAADGERFDTKRLQKEMPGLYDQYKVTSLGSRRFLVK